MAVKFGQPVAIDIVDEAAKLIAGGFGEIRRGVGMLQTVRRNNPDLFAMSDGHAVAKDVARRAGEIMVAVESLEEEAQ